MKRTVRRILVIGLSMVLGWYAAGFAPALGLGAGTSLASDASGTPDASGKPSAAVAPTAESEQPGGEATESPAGGTAASPRARVESAMRGKEANPAVDLVPQTESEVSWYWSMVMGVVLLFVAALVFGYMALKLQPPPPPEPVKPDDAHDDHGHDAHAPDAHGHDDHGTKPTAALGH